MTHKPIIALLPVLAWVGFTPAHAAPQTRTFSVTGQVGSSCSLGTNSAPLTLATTVPTNGKLDTNLNGKTFTLTNAICSAPSSIIVRSTVLRRAPPNPSVPNGQSQAANFTATATGWSSTPATVTTAETSPLGSTTTYSGTARSQNTAKTGTITVTFSNFTTVTGPNGNGTKLVDGSYSATITVSLTPSS